MRELSYTFRVRVGFKLFGMKMVSQTCSMALHINMMLLRPRLTLFDASHDTMWSHATLR